MKSFKQFLLEENSENSKGTYAAVTFSDATIENIMAYIKEHEIPNAVEPEKLHCTVCYSRVVVDVPTLETIDPPWIAKPIGFDIFGDESKCLVLKLESEDLRNRFQEYMDAGATYDYEEYAPHITLSYDISNFDTNTLSDFVDDVEIVAEYTEELDLDK